MIDSLGTVYSDYLFHNRPKILYIILSAGLDEGEQNPSDQSSVQGAYLSFLYLRHLRIRDLQRSVSVQFFPSFL